MTEYKTKTLEELKRDLLERPPFNNGSYRAGAIREALDAAIEGRDKFRVQDLLAWIEQELFYYNTHIPDRETRPNLYIDTIVSIHVMDRVWKHVLNMLEIYPTTISPEEACSRFPNDHPVITRVDDGEQFVRQPDGMYVMWTDDPKFRGPQCLQHRYPEHHLKPPEFK